MVNRRCCFLLFSTSVNHKVFQTGRFSECIRKRCHPTFALWFWNHTCTTLTVSPVSAARVSLTCNNSACMRWTFESDGSAVSTYNAHRRPVTTDLSAGFGRHLEGSLEGATLLRGQDGTWSLGSLVILPIIPSLPPDGDTATLLILTLYCGGKLSIGLKVNCVVS